jgi:hypothetical protein
MNNKVVIGRELFASMPDLGIQTIVAKVDTGAYSASLHADDISEEDGVLSFVIHPTTQIQTEGGVPQTIATMEYRVKRVKSSNGHVGNRYLIQMPVIVAGQQFEADITLTSRTGMRYPMLIGRTLLRNRFVVDVELDNQTGEKL